ncbi:hypothetical protein Clacol_002761 [Clathrus columnatus]|uniref:Pre-mRNA-splicing factor 18 n=1 Tax=Clathrus columnatus TaxID=1419009 RepID=A0AAV5A5Q7_9AGAM|nr:hypothetical protein Clacol_002761 [Clathrus columnatus]
MEALKAQIALKRKVLGEETDNGSRPTKYMKKGDVEKIRLQQENERRERETREQSEKEKYTEAQLENLARTSKSPGPSSVTPEPSKPEGTFNVSNEEAIRRLRLKGQPIRLFGETDKDRRLRLRALELIEEKEKGGGTNDFKKALEDVENMQREERASNAKRDVSAGKEKEKLEERTSVIDLGLVKTDPDRLHPLIYHALKRTLKEWEEFMDQRPDHIKHSMQGRLAAATQKQSADYLKPLFKLLRTRTLPSDMLARIAEIVYHMQMRQYQRANDAYLRLSIGNAPWPIGVTMVGIHERSAREKISSDQVAHVLNDEISRKYIQSLKSDPAVKQLLVTMNEKEGFIILELDDNHVLIKADAEDRVRRELETEAELETWDAALKAYDVEDFDKSLQLFSTLQTIADSSKILTNIALIYATLGEHEAAIENFNAATSLDQYLAVAYFQCGVSNFLLQRYDLALKDFEEALLNLRGNQAINYEQLGLQFKLYSAEVLFNKGLSQVYMGSVDDGLKDMREASLMKCTSEHNVIDEAIRDRAEGYTVFSIPVGVLYRPSENKIKNSASKDYLGKAKLIAVEDEREAYTSFTGVTRFNQGLTPSGARRDDISTETFDATVNLKRSVTVAAFSSKEPNNITTLNRAPTTINVISREERTPRYAAVAKDPGGNEYQNSSKLSPPRNTINQRRSRSSSPKDKGARLTEIYDQYINNDRGTSGLPDQDGKQRVAAWARSNANPPPLRRGLGAEPNYASSSFGTLLQRKRTGKRQHGPISGAVYEEEEEGYGSGEELVKIRIKIHFGGDVRGMTVTRSMPFDEFVDRVTQKFDKSFDGLGMKFKDEDGTLITLMDESDYDLALETAWDATSKGKSEKKLEIWCKGQ